MQKLSETRILLIWDRMGDYHRARWHKLREKIGNDKVFAADLGTTDNLYHWRGTEGNEYHFCLSTKPVQQRDVVVRVWNFYRVVQKWKVNTVVQSGYGKWEYVLIMILSKILGLKVILFAESWYPGSNVTDKLKGLFLKFFAGGLFVSGKRAQDHFMRRIGINATKIVTGYSVVDNDHFHNPSAKEKQWSLNNGSELSLPTELPENLKPYLLCVARYSEEKNLKFLIDAYKRSRLYKQWKLVLIGEGPQKEELQVAAGDDKTHIFFVSWKAYDELPYWYNSAEAFVLPSEFEPWGLVVNEAMAAGLPVVVSKQCGCVDDLLERDQLVFDAREKSELMDKLNLLYRISADARKQIGENNLEKVQAYSLDHWADNLMRLC